MIYAIASVFFIVVLVLLFRFLHASEEKRNTGGRKTGSSKESRLYERLFLPEYKRIGLQGERQASGMIASVLWEDDRLFTNVSIAFDGRSAELDNVIVNRFGVFIIEVKNYAGRIYGGEEEYQWKKLRVTQAGNIYVKEVKNPIKQVKRQVYILAHYLDCYGVNVWVKGYAMLLQNNSPVESEYILDSPEAIGRAIHSYDRRPLDRQTVDRITELLS